MAEYNKTMMNMISRDGEIFQVSHPIASMCKTFDRIINEDDDIDEQSDLDLPCDRVSSKILTSVIIYCTYHTTQEQMESINTPFKSTVLTEIVTQQWYANFIKDVDDDTLFGLVQAAIYLEIQPLSSLALL